jgi:hypothetical protein
MADEQRIAKAVNKDFSFPRSQEIGQIPPLPGRELIPKCRHAAEAEGDGLEDG